MVAIEGVPVRPSTDHSIQLKPFAIAALAMAGLMGFYLGIITWAQGWDHATQQLADDRWFIGAIVLGFGTQVGLFVYLRQLRARAALGGMAASTGASTAAMLACCAHHLTDVLPVLGLSGVAIFLNDYKIPLLWLGIGMNYTGVAYLLWQVRRQRRLACSTGGSQPEHKEHGHEAHA